MNIQHVLQKIQESSSPREFFRGAYIVVYNKVDDVSTDVFNYEIHGVIPIYVYRYVEILDKDQYFKG